ncbi:MAG: UDP-3-O-acyl-N-acetylglucosamine deacetylase [Planctomycetaceae bacterium]|jgi:UDP-3-O-acyl N-acetylglucosamine deacetylase|nr:UDP-3-O-acyl-N-acetylglucosamine deacetylase [Planctomycetaceae bacterium]
MQRTITKPVILDGFGFWSGKDIRVEFRPARPGRGIVFIRTDLPGSPEIPASAENQIVKLRQTSLCCGGAQVDMVEHLMAALAGLEIDNCEVHVNEQEIPGFDGSARPFAKALLQSGMVTQPALRPKRIIYKTVRVGDEKRWIEARPNYTGRTTLTYHLEYPQDSPIVSQSYRFVVSPENFVTQLVSCRTFLMKSEADKLVAAGLCQRVSQKDVLVLDENGPLDNQFLFPDECARHKLLDMIGDFALGECDWVGDFIACRSGHQMNVECVRKLLNTSVHIESDVVPVHENQFTAKA